MVVENGFGDPSNDGNAKDRGLSPVVGFVLLLGLVIVASSFIFLSGVTILDNVDQEMDEQTAEQSMRQVDKDLSTLTFSDRDHATLQLDDSYNLTDGGKMSVTLSNRFGDSCSKEMALGTLEYESNNGNTIAHQAGGVWRKSDGGSTVVSKPDVRYYDKGTGDEEQKVIDISVTNVTGSIGSGEHTATRSFDSSDDLSCVRNETFGFARYVTFEVAETPYHNAWYDFLQEEFDAKSKEPSDDCEIDDGDNVICHDEGSETVTVVATLDHERPFADYVDVSPTIYGGLYVTGGEERYNNKFDVTIDRYDGRTGPYDPNGNSTEDLFVADVEGARLNSANIDGIPVINGELSANPQASVSSIAYAVDPHGDPLDPANGTNIYKLNDDILAAEMSESFDGIDSIDDEIEIAIDHLQNEESLEGDIEAAEGGESLYYEDDDNEYSGTIDTSNGDVHIAVDGDLKLEDATIKGDGQVYFYVTGDIDVQDVAVDGDRASGLWVYGTSDAVVRIVNSFQGVVYAPGSDLTFPQNNEDDVEIYGAVVSGDHKPQEMQDVAVHFDRSLRTDIPIPPENRNLLIEIEETRTPLDVTFVLDRSGSMGDSIIISGSYWQDAPRSIERSTVHPEANHSIEIEVCSWSFSGTECSTSIVEPGESINTGFLSSVDKIRVQGDCNSCKVPVVVENGNDPLGLRADATRNFIGMLNESDRAGVYEFNDSANTLHELSDDLEAVNNSVTASANRGTNMPAGMEAALDDHEEKDNGAKKIMILLSDGENSHSSYDDRMDELADRAVDEDVTIYTVGLGYDDLNEELLNETATKTGGYNVNVDNAEELEKEFAGIASEVTATSDTTFEINTIYDPTGSSNEYVVNVREWDVEIDE